jgi:LL-H family phage holin
MNMDDRLFQLILAIIPVLGTIITVFIIPLLKEKIDADKLAKYKEWANLAVKCAEMLWTETGHGADKKQYVVDYLNNMFNSKKTVITEEQLNVLIESAVQSLNTEK